MINPTDKNLLDFLESEMRDHPLVLWYGNGHFPGNPSVDPSICGLSLLNGKRTLRQAIEECLSDRCTPVGE